MATEASAEPAREPIDNFEIPITCTDDSAKLKITMSGAKQSGTLRHLIIDLEYDRAAAQPIPVLVPDASTDALRVVLDFCEKAARDSERADFKCVDPSCRTKVARILDWQVELIKPHEESFTMLRDIITYADYMDVQDLVLLAAHAIARKITGMTTELMRGYMGVTEKTDGENFGFTAEQLKEIEEEVEFLRRLDADRASRTAQAAK